MKHLFLKGLCVSGSLALLLTAASAQEQPVAGQLPRDPRPGLAAGFKDAAVAAWHMELVANAPKPPGFFHPDAPAGDPLAERDADEEKPGAAQAPGDTKQPSRPQRVLEFANSDLAFRDRTLFIGNFSGFNIYDIGGAPDPKLIASVLCPGGQGDVSVHGNLLIMSVEETRGRVDCGTQGVKETVSKDRFRGVRIFDISDLRKPRQIAAVQTCRGSHTHTLLVDPKDTSNIYVYGSGTGTPRAGEELQGCSGGKPEEDPHTALFSIDVIQIPLSSPEKARVVARPRIFADPATGSIAGLWPGGDHGPGTQRTSETNRCHDITVFPELGLAAGACSGNGILLDISDPVKPVRLDAVSDKNFAFWHSATFNNDGTKVIFTDEWGGGTRPRCRTTDQREWGANAIFDIVDRKLVFRSYYKLPAPQGDTENCVAHNGSLVPVPGRDIMVQGWYQGGVSVFDFTDSSRPYEIAYFDRGPVDPARLHVAGHWAAYWYNGLIYGAEMARGLDVFRLVPSEHLTRDELDAAQQVTFSVFNPQQQPRITWAPTPAVARAYVDQLVRTQALTADRAEAVRLALEQHDRTALPKLAAEMKDAAGTADVRSAARLRALSTTLEALATR